MSNRQVHWGYLRLKTLLRAALLYGALCVVTSAPAQTPTPFGVDVPHIALLVPVDSGVFRLHAEALRDGFLAASQFPDPPTLMIRIYPAGDEPRQAVASYRLAVQSGARLVVGPLVRSAVNAVAAEVSNVPTLLLNAPDGPPPNRPNLYLISLQIEAEARQAAQLAIRDGRRVAYTVSGDSPLLRRVHQAFIDTFVSLGGRHAGEIRYGTPANTINAANTGGPANPGGLGPGGPAVPAVPGVSAAETAAALARMRAAAESRVADMAFLALDATQVREVHAALSPLALYASSQATSTDAAATAAVASIRILDMPWLLQRDHPAVRLYPRKNYEDADLERLYALGIDAWRIGQAILARHTEITLEGVTGRLTLGSDRRFSRELATAQRSDSNTAAIPPGPISPAAPIAFPPPTRPAPRP